MTTSRAPASTRTAPRITIRLLVALLGAPVAWLLHLAACYVLVALECNGGMSDAAFTAVLLALTLLLAAAAAAAGYVAFRMLPPQDRSAWAIAGDELGGREQFLAGTGLVLSAIFVLLIVLEGISPLIAPWCAEVMRIAW
jgi:hypothetical protein